MGYRTEFAGRFHLDRPLEPAHRLYLERFAHTRRMRRDTSVLRHLPDPVREAVGLPLGIEGGYFLGASQELGEPLLDPLEASASILDANSPPCGQPGLWCGWVPTREGRGLGWNGIEKFYDYVTWLDYLIDHFLARWGYVVSGEVHWLGEDPKDRGVLMALANHVIAYEVG